MEDRIYSVGCWASGRFPAPTPSVLVACQQRMNFKTILLSGVTSVSMLVSLACVSAHAQTAPVADHHAHLQSPVAAHLLNEGANRDSHRMDDNEEEKPS